MDFETYKAWREDALTRHQPARFDCLNPFLAMEHTRRWAPSGTIALHQDALDTWTALHHAPAVHWQATGGVRAALGHLMAAAGARGMEIWLPQDVYPFYAQEAAQVAPHAPIHRFATLPTPDFAPLQGAGPSALLVITHPLSPLGRFLSPRELHALRTWSQNGPDRWVALDSVYLYTPRWPAGYAPGFGEGRILGLFSLSKSWLLRGVWGTIGGPTRGDSWWHSVPVPSPEASGMARDALTQDPTMPARQRHVFQREWRRRGWMLDAYARPPAGPGRGYFQPLHVRAERALERDNILLVPASVFGHPDPEWSVATCLYEAANHATTDAGPL